MVSQRAGSAALGQTWKIDERDVSGAGASWLMERGTAARGPPKFPEDQEKQRGWFQP